LAFGTLTISALVMDINQARGIEEQIVSLKSQLTELRNRHEDLQRSTWDKVKRVRAGMLGFYGDDSSQYEMVGGKRRSERKKPGRKALR
jgi:hypothetical protein